MAMLFGDVFNGNKEQESNHHLIKNSTHVQARGVSCLRVLPIHALLKTLMQQPDAYM